MIQKETKLKVIDNSGAKTVLVFGISGRSGKGSCSQFKVGDVVRVAIKSAIPNGKVSKGSKSLALIVRTRYPLPTRKNGQVIKFNENSVVLLDLKSKLLVGTIIFGDVPREIFKNFQNKESKNILESISVAVKGSIL